MNNLFLKNVIILALSISSLLAQQKRVMWKELVDKKGVKYLYGSKKPFSGRVFDEPY